MNLALLASSFAVILAGALLFTNAVEWMGNRLAMGEAAVGSLLAAVGTAMPETLIPVVAILEGKPDGVAIGAIVGAPFLLATIAMMLIGLVALGYRHRRPQGRRLEAHAPALERDLTFFAAFFAFALLLGLGTPLGVRAVGAVVMVSGYAVYVSSTLRQGGAVEAEDRIGPLIIDRTRAGRPPIRLILVQLLIGIGAVVGGAHLFVNELIKVSNSIGVEALVLSLVMAPLATELPEKANSFVWVREGKDSLALGNVTGAMVFQSTIPVAVGLAFTAWSLDGFAIFAMALGLLGGAVAYWALRLRERFELPAILAWGALYASFLIAVVIAA